MRITVRICTLRNNAPPQLRMLARLLLGAFGCLHLVLCSHAESLPRAISISNDRPFAREGEIIKITRAELHAETSIRVPVFLQRGEVLPSQLLDDDTTGAWTAVLIQVSVPPRTRQELRLRWVMPEEVSKRQHAT